MITLDFLFTMEAKFFMEQAGALKCGLLPEVIKFYHLIFIIDFSWKS